jgi:hypothetical protein
MDRGSFTEDVSSTQEEDFPPISDALIGSAIVNIPENNNSEQPISTPNSNCVYHRDSLR